MMSPDALARFLEEDIHILRRSNHAVTVALLAALDAAVELLKEAEACMTLAGDSERKIACRTTLRLVLGEKERQE